MNRAEIIERCTVRDYMGTKAPYVDLGLVRQYSEELHKELLAKWEAARNEDPFAGYDWEASLI